MTVAAVILSATAEGALADTLGQPRVRRLVDIAWSGGALPVVVVSPDDDGAVAAALVGSEAVYGAPAPRPRAVRPARWSAAPRLALAEVRDTSAVLIWPARMTWVGPETVTSLIEAHGTDAATILRPAWDGTPAGRCSCRSRTWRPARRGPGPDAAGRHRRARRCGTVPRSSRSATPASSTTPRPPYADLPPYDGPPDPPAGHTHEWGDGVEEGSVDEGVPGEGRGLAPYPQAGSDGALDPALSASRRPPPSRPGRCAARPAPARAGPSRPRSRR